MIETSAATLLLRTPQKPHIRLLNLHAMHAHRMGKRRSVAAVP
jgi:hypothetical protein